jgi:signal transduction histidine kinase
VVIHRPARSATDELAAHLGPAALLAIDNERLRASLLAQLAALRASRARVVESSDRERRRLERDLHDGAQQRVLAAAYSLRRARISAAAQGDAATDTVLEELDELVAESGTVMSELRELAQGIFPAVIDEAGLEPALQTLADRAPVVLDVDVQGTAPPVPAARAAYELVQTAARAPGPHGEDAGLRVRIDGRAGVLVVDVDGAPAADYERCADRIGALGGRLVVHGEHLRAEIPCE